MAEDSSKIFKDIQDVPWLLKPHVHMKDPEKVVEKLNCIIRDGSHQLQAIFDFDRTLTKHHVNGVITNSSYGVLESMPTIPTSFCEHSKASLAKYRPIETDPNMSTEEKIPYMLEWWTSGIEVMKGIPWDVEIVDSHLRENQLPIRDGTKLCFQQLHEAGVPVLVFSAGMGDVVKLSLSHQGLLTPNVHVVSNFLKIVDGKIVGYIDDKLIHVFNKNELAIRNSPYFEELSGRKNVILLGDSTGDATMADGVSHDTVLKIGFLNTNIEESMRQFMETFDIVLADDQTMDVLTHILKILL